MPFLVCSHELHTCKSLRCTLQPLWPGVALGPSWPVTQSSTAQQIMDIIPPAAVHTRMNSVRESCRQKKRKKIGHHARPRRASATAPLRTGADVCKTGSAAGKCAGAKSNTARRRSNHARTEDQAGREKRANTDASGEWRDVRSVFFFLMTRNKIFGPCGHG